MYRLRKEDVSVYLYLKDSILSEFIEFQDKDNLVQSASMTTPTSKVYTIDTYLEPSPFERGRGIVYFDDLGSTCLVPDGTVSGTNEQVERVIVYDETMTPIDDNDYMIDYLDGRIITYNNVSPVYIDYFWNYVSLVDEWSAITAADPPVVVIDINTSNKAGYQMGGGKKSIRKGTLVIFASSTAERNDIAEVLYDGLYLKSCPLYVLPEGTVLDYDGTFRGRKEVVNKDDNQFLRTTVSGVSMLQFENVIMKHINLPIAMSKGKDEVALSDLNAYRSKITFDIVSYSNGWHSLYYMLYYILI